MKKCSGCHAYKSKQDFYRKKSAKSGLTSKCKDCTNSYHRQKYEQDNHYYRRKHLKRLYNLTLDDFDVLLAQQNYQCAICSCQFEETPHIDHCHLTGKVRGLLCNGCNVGIGYFRDNPEIASQAAKYLRENSP